jgi:hypothetical protein
MLNYLHYVDGAAVVFLVFVFQKLTGKLEDPSLCQNLGQFNCS